MRSLKKIWEADIKKLEKAGKDVSTFVPKIALPSRKRGGKSIVDKAEAELLKYSPEELKAFVKRLMDKKKQAEETEA